MKLRSKWKVTSLFLVCLLFFTQLTSAFVPVVQLNAAENNTEDLFISEYIEGSSNNKALELYNTTGEAIDLSSYTLELYSNGKTSVQSILQLSGTLSDGDVYVIANSSASAEIKAVADLLHNVSNFNGNDAITLKKNSEIIDVIGEVGNDTEYAKDVTLVRNVSVLSGNPRFDASEWSEYPQDTLTYLGSYGEEGDSSGGDPTEPGEVVSIADARQQANGNEVTIEGVVTSGNLANPNGTQLSYYIQDQTAGINLFSLDGTGYTELTEGDHIKVTGELAEYNGLKEIVPASNEAIEVSAKGVALPSPAAVTIAELNNAEVAEPLEGQLVQVTGYVESIPDSPAGGGYNISLINSALNSTTLRVMEGTIDPSTLEEGKWYDITAVLSQYNSYQLFTRKAADVQLAEGQPEGPDASGEYTATVDYVTDGDTIRLQEGVLGSDRVRFINIDTPELSVDGANGVDEANQKEHAQAAKDRLSELLQPGDQITLKIGEEATDQYGRLLAEVINNDGINTNLEMVEEGLATTYFIWPVGDEEVYQTYQDTVEAAIDNELGIWNPENPLKELPFEYRAITEGGDFHRYVGNSETMVYVEPTEYEEVPVEKRIFFASAQEAEAQGYTAAGGTDPDSEMLEVQLLSMNDLHGKIDQEYTLNLDGGDAIYGRMDYTASAIKEREQENENTLLVHAGDMIGGSSPVSALLQDEPTVEIMNEMGFDVGTLGNHEYDEGLGELNRMIDGGDHPEGLGTEGYGGMNFDMICANCMEEDTGETFLPPYVIKEVDGVEIGFVGVNTQETMNMVMPSSLENVAFTDETEAVNDAVEELQEQGVESIVVLAHMSATQSGAAASGAAADLAKGVNDAVDIIFAAHNHQVVDGVVDNKWIIQASEYGKAFADVDLQIDRETKDIEEVEAEVVFVKQEDYQPDPAVKDILDRYQSEVETIINEEIGYNGQELTGQYTNDGDHGLGNLIADGMKWAMDADFAMHNGGGIRDSLDVGPITWGEVFNILPFANTLMSVDIKGKDLIPILNNNLSSYGSDYSVSGLHYTYNYDYQHVVDITLPDGTPIDPEATYTLATNNYIGTQDGPIKNLGTNVQMGPVDVDAAVDYLKHLDTTQANPLVIGPEGRIAQTDEIPDIDTEGEVIGYNAQDLMGAYTNGKDHGLGNLITDSMKAEMDTDFAVTNGGGISSTLLKGDITAESLDKILKHGNTLVKMEVTGAELESILNDQLSEDGSDYSVSGFHYQYDHAEQKVVSITLPDGEAVDPDEVYTLTTNNYLAESGVFASIDSEQEEGPVDVEALENYIVSLETTEINPLVYGSEGRISTVPVVIVPEIEDNNATVENEVIDNVPNHGTVIIDLSEEEHIDESKPLEVSFAKEQIAMLKEKQAELRIEKSDVTLAFPLSLFSGDENVTIKIEKLEEVEGALSTVYDFTIMEGNKMIHDFSDYGGVELSLKVNEKDVSDIDSMKIFYLNDETGEWEVIGGSYKNGKVTATTNHFSTFTVMLDTSSDGGDDTDPESPVNPEDPADPADPAGENNNTDGGNDSTDDNTDNNDASTVSNAGNTLPDTATSIFNYMLAGLFVFALGFLLMIRQRIKKS
ncbi:5'-nucleotidase C-terminal domain-containing protein [Gracilibacillus caseinilyticus]|uniref:5'-nucleotidase C-terminal domain-containing protein n=1 Tax=Gracilibacillus caseinilyticus TaxID=2932256 RepID=A0ABY4F0B8_9BACI|nr:5'-nucleotidase C-terminal domain-containing protein [Gracilibacillus caseinilyticus]UOQ50106.1 5'-nucleotidase C-terminal domain-containing protein [Gracilibacillus caseinilyticus]